jgi:hypothetical protein
MKTSVTLSVSAVALLVGTISTSACEAIGGDFSVGAPETGQFEGGGGAEGGGVSAEGGGGDSSTPLCKGDTVAACGAACTACTPPTGGAVACTAAACVQTCTAATEKACGDKCLDTSISAVHCGRCDHSCEAGKCVAGACQPFPVATGFTAVHAIDISASGLVISADGDLTLCSAAGGCTATTLKTVGTGFNQLGDAARL